MLIRFYNVQVGRSAKQVAREIRALLAARPQVLGLCETVGYVLPEIPGYTLLRNRKDASHANIAAYVRGHPTNVHWIPQFETWGRTERPGEHEPRVILEFRTGGIQVLVAHQPPKGTDNVIRSQQEGIDTMVRRMGPWTRIGWKMWEPTLRRLALLRPRFVIMDANRGPNEEGPGPKQLAEKINGEIVGFRIDLGVVRGGEVSKPRYFEEVGEVKLHSDHKHAFEFHLSVPDRWQP